MQSATSIGRVGGLAVALGIGAWLASVPWSAAADPAATGSETWLWPAAASTDPSSGLDIAPWLGGIDPDPTEMNIDVSIWGMDVFQQGNATAESSLGNVAIAIGAGSNAEAGTSASSPGGFGDFAFANGADSSADAEGKLSTATASDPNSMATTAGLFSSASASGEHSTAAAGGNFSSASASGDYSTATSGGGSFANASGDGSTATAGGLFNNASVFGTDSTATAELGNNNTALVFGDHSTALAGGHSGVDQPFGNNDFAAVFGDHLTADASGGSNLFVIEPPLFGTDAAATAASSGDFGLGDLLNELGLGGLMF